MLAGDQIILVDETHSSALQSSVKEQGLQVHLCMQAFKQRTQQQFGSGWVWLAVDRSDYDVGPKDPEALVIIALPNQVPHCLMQIIMAPALLHYYCTS